MEDPDQGQEQEQEVGWVEVVEVEVLVEVQVEEVEVHREAQVTRMQVVPQGGNEAVSARIERDLPHQIEAMTIMGTTMGMYSLV